MSTDSSPKIISPMFIGRNWNGSSEQRGARRCSDSPVRAPMPQHGSTGSKKSAPDSSDGSCIICSPPFRGAVTNSPLGKIEEDSTEQHGMEALKANAWLSPAICSPLNDRFYAPVGFMHLQASPRLNTAEDEAITEEAFTNELEVLAAIGSHLDDEEELQKELQEEACGGREKQPGDEGDYDDFSTICGGADGDAMNSKFGSPMPFNLAYGNMPSSRCTAHGSVAGSSKSLSSGTAVMDSRKEYTKGRADHVIGIGGYSLANSGTEEERKEEHWKMASMLGFAGFRCNCRIARQRQAPSCLERFGKEKFRRWHNETYLMDASTKKEGTKQSLKDRVTSSIFAKMWSLKTPATDTLDAQDRYGRKFVIQTWMLDGYEVCRDAWELAVGGSKKKHRTLYSLVCGGYGPTDLEARKTTKKLLEKLETQTDAVGRRDNERRGFAANWWKNYLLLCDYLPNEERIQIRGPSDEKLHQLVYKPAAVQAGLYLGKNMWKECAKEGLRLLAALLPGANPTTLKASRAARHSKFPECQKCQDKRKAWMDACQNLSSDKEWVQSLFQDMLDHQKEWSADRATALAIRRSLFHPDATGIYECDDKCGSWWQVLPVDPTGREGKQTDQSRFHFSVQANVVCGLQGVLRFAIVPKFISTGGNFGLTNLLMVLYRAKTSGRLQPHVNTMYRHTVRCFACQTCLPCPKACVC